jgi:hypothetical protein
MCGCWGAGKGSIAGEGGYVTSSLSIKQGRALPSKRTNFAKD